MTTLRIGVIGAGVMGADHVRTCHTSVTGAEVTLVADLDRDRAVASVAGIPGARATDDPLALIADSTVDAVLVASHDDTHAELVMACLAEGKPVLCEKPLAPRLADCATLVEAERRGGKPLVSLGFMRRFDPGYVELKAAVHAGTVGRPLALHCVSRGVASAPGSTSESSVTNSAIHEFDTVPWLLGSPVSEVAWHAPKCSSEVTGMQDPQLILLRTEDGVLSTAEVFLNARYGYDIRCEVVGESGAVSLAGQARLVLDSARSRGSEYPADWRPRFADAYRLELLAWADAVRRDETSPLASARDGLLAASVADAVLRSMREGGVTAAVRVP